MKILASVYACSPYDGSERAVGWNWLCELNKYHEITALTSSVYKNDIEDYKSKYPGCLSNTNFVYIEVPYTSWHVGYNKERIYYMLWQRHAYKIAKKIIQNKHFDLVHHITYVTCVMPTYMYKLEIPFVYGPVSGGENIPAIIKYPLDKGSKRYERLRTAVQTFFRYTPNYHEAMKHAGIILATTEETKKIIPTKYHYKTKIFQAIGLSSDIFWPELKEKPKRKTKFLMAGRMLYWKGYEIGIPAFVKAVENGCEAELTILGYSEDKVYKEKLMNMCGLHLGKEIKFVDCVEYNRMKEFYDGFDVLLNCSLRDSGNFVVMEAMSRGLPVICVNTGGPKVNTTDKTAIKINPTNIDEMIIRIAEAIEKMATNNLMRKLIGVCARQYALDNFLIDKRTQIMNQIYEEVVDNSKR